MASGGGNALAAVQPDDAMMLGAILLLVVYANARSIYAFTTDWPFRLDDDNSG